MKKIIFILFSLFTSSTSYSQSSLEVEFMGPYYRELKLIPSVDSDIEIPTLRAFIVGEEHVIYFKRSLNPGDSFLYDVDVDFKTGEYTVKEYSELHANNQILQWKKEDGLSNDTFGLVNKTVNALTLNDSVPEEGYSLATLECQLSAFSIVYDPPALVINRTTWWWYWTDNTTADEVTLTDMDWFPYGIASPTYWYIIDASLAMSHGVGQPNSIIAGNLETDYINWDWLWPHLSTSANHWIGIAVWSEGTYEGGYGAYQAAVSTAGENHTYLSPSFAGSLGCY